MRTTRCSCGGGGSTTRAGVFLKHDCRPDPGRPGFTFTRRTTSFPKLLTADPGACLQAGAGIIDARRSGAAAAEACSEALSGGNIMPPRKWGPVDPGWQNLIGACWFSATGLFIFGGPPRRDYSPMSRSPSGRTQVPTCTTILLKGRIVAEIKFYTALSGSRAARRRRVWAQVQEMMGDRVGKTFLLLDHKRPAPWTRRRVEGLRRKNSALDPAGFSCPAKGGFRQLDCKV